MDDTESAATNPVDRLGLEIIDPDVCWDLMTETPVGRLAFVDDGSPMVLPVIHSVVGRRIVFRSSPGEKLAAARMRWPVAFEVDEWDAVHRTGWSVVARGTAQSAPEDAAELDALHVEPWLEATAWGTWIEIQVDEISGRRLGHTQE